MKLNSLQALYINGIRDLHSAETQILKALPRMQKGATNTLVKQAFMTHLEQTRVHIARLEWICEVLGVSTKGKRCKGMAGLIAEGAQLLDEKADADVMDAGLISAAQHIEHYEMAGYGTVRTYATLLGYEAQAATLQSTLLDERECDQELTRLALTVNVDAMDEAEGSTREFSSEVLQALHL